MKTSLSALVVLACSLVTVHAADPTHPVLFVTQVPMPEEVNTRSIVTSYMSCVSPFGNHLGGTAFSGRGGSLWVRFPANANPTLNHQLFDLLSVADWSAVPGGKPAANTVAVRNPCVHWLAGKAVFSMVVGAPVDGNDNTEFFWQLYEITLPTQAQLNASVKPVISKVANQPPFNNIMPCYTPDNKLVFASDRPYNGASYLRQREEYLGLPTTSGLWKLDPTDASSLTLLHHSPSGAFSPFVDSSGRLIFVNWDHLSRDIEAVTDERDSNPNAPYNEPAPGTFSGWFRTTNGSGNFADETAAAAFTPGTVWTQGQHLDFFPEPRNSDKKTLFDEFGIVVNGTTTSVINGVTTNLFMPWMINLDGTGGELLNHVGRHEVAGSFNKNFTQDGNLLNFNPATNMGYGGLVAHNSFNNFMWVHEDPLNSGVFYGVDSVDLGTHGAGGIVKLVNAGSGVNPDTMQVVYITGSVTGASRPQAIPPVRVGMNITSPTSPFTPLTTPETIYRSAVPLSDGALVASMASGIDQTDWNRGTVTQPSTPFNFRLTSLKVQGSSYVSDVLLTSGLKITTSYFVPGQAQPVSFSNVNAWELDPVEVAARNVPSIATSSVDPIESAVFTANGVDLPTFQKYLVNHNAALSVSRDVTKRDMHDRQQPFNLNVTWSNHSTSAPGTTGLYNVAWLQILEADVRRGYTLGGASAVEGRRVVATPLHMTASENVPVAGAPAGAVKLGNDGSFAAIVPAGKGLTWHLLDNDAAKTSQVKERFWVTFQKGEVRTCANCHGINTSDQTGTVANPVPKPTNPPQALAALLQFWKTNNPPGNLQLSSANLSAQKNSGSATITFTRTSGTVGPVSVSFTLGGTAVGGVDYTAPVVTTVTWADGDTAPKTITIPLLNNPVIAASKTITVTLGGAVNGSLGATADSTLSINEPPFNAWLFQSFGASANTAGTGGDNDDPDHDGYCNLVEYALAGNPKAPDAALLQTPYSELLNAVPVFSLNFNRDLSRSDITMRVQASADLVSWQDVTDSLVSTAGNIETRKASVPQSSGLRFFHLVVTRP